MKKLLLIGNKPLDKDYSSEINKYDKVIRINRATNYDMSKGRTDLWLADIHGNWFDNEPKDKFVGAKKAIVFNHHRECAMRYFNKINYRGDIQFMSFDDIPICQYIGVYDVHERGMQITNAVWMLIYCLEYYAKDYQIYVLGYSGRDFLKSPLYTYHDKIYKAEDYLYKSLVNSGAICPLDDVDNYDVCCCKAGYTGNIPLFSSFWHSDSDILPDLVVASINSFIKNECPYNLYVYKQYQNIPDGCVIKDANEILPYSELFVGSRNDYASFADMFRAYLVNKVDTAWTDTDNFFIADDFPTRSVFIIQNGRIQNSFFYIANDSKGKLIKRMLLDFYEAPSKRQSYDNDEMKRAKVEISIYRGRKAQLSHARWGVGGSCLFTIIHDLLDLSDCVYEYEKYFNSFHFTEQFQLWDYEESPYMNYCNRNVKILVMSMALLDRDQNVMKNYNDKSYMANLINKYK